MRGRIVTCWHPDSPGSKVTVWRPWWTRKKRPFATLTEVLRTYRHRRQTLNITEHHG